MLKFCVWSLTKAAEGNLSGELRSTVFLYIMLLQIIGGKKSKFIQILTSCNGFIKINMHLIPNQVIKKK